MDKFKRFSYNFNILEFELPSHICGERNYIYQLHTFLELNKL